MLGVLFTIPLRRALIIDQPLQFPEGVATAEVLKVGAEGGGGVGVLVLAARHRRGRQARRRPASSCGPRSSSSAAGSRGRRREGAADGEGAARRSTSASTRRRRCSSVGYIVGFNVARVIFAGAVVNRWIAVPLFALFGDPRRSSRDITSDLHATRVAIDDSSSAPLPAAGARRRERARRGRRDPRRRHALPRRRRHARRRRVVAVSSCASRCSAASPPASTPTRSASAGGADACSRTEHDMPMNIILILIARVGHPAVLHLQALHRLDRHQRRDGDRDDHRRLPVLRGRVVHGRPRRLVEQPGLGHHDLDDPRRRAAAARHGPQAARPARSPRS